MLYALAAGAAAACAPGAQAKVVFTPNNTVLHSRHHIDIDLNNDGKTDFRLIASSFKNPSSYFIAELGMTAAPGNSVDDLGVTSYKRHWALALTKGAEIGPGAKFLRYGLVELSNVGIFSEGYFKNVSNRFLGVRFLINGAPHYGWIGFRQVTLVDDHGDITATLAGWAYEAESNTPIRAGDKGAEESAALRSVEPTSLELLAAGNVAMADWRRRRAG